jgi:hypothetical protein
VGRLLAWMVLAPCSGLRGTADRLMAGGEMLRIAGRAPTNQITNGQSKKSRSTESIIEHRGEPARMTMPPSPGEAVGSSPTKPKAPTPEHRHTGNPPGLCLGRTILICKVGKAPATRRKRLRPGLRRPILARLRRAAAARMEARLDVSAQAGRAISLTKKATQISLSLDNRCRGNCPTTPPVTSSSCSRRRRWRAPAGSRVVPSIGRLHAASCGQRGSATGSGSNPPSWNAGSGSRLFRPTFRRALGGRGLPGMFRAVVCGLCSTRWATDRRMR